jgi:hypothetical protein
MAIVKIGGVKKGKLQRSEKNKRKKEKKLRSTTMWNIVCCNYTKIYIVLNC